MQPTTVHKLSKLSLLGGLLLLLLVGYAASRVQYGTAVVEDWLPADSASLVKYRQFREWFGTDQYLLVSWKDCDLDDPRLPAMSGVLRQLAEQQGRFAIQAVEDSQRAIEEFTSRSPDVDRQGAIGRLEGIFVGSQSAAFIGLRLGEAPHAIRDELIAVIERLAERVGIRPEALILAGEPYQVHVIDQASRHAVNAYVVPSSLLALLIAGTCLRSLQLTSVVFAFAGMGQLLGLALIAITIVEMSSVLVVLPTLVFMLTLSAAIHLAHYYRDAGGSSNRCAGTTALRLGWRPCLLATLTTAFGFGSLAVSQLSPVWQFGVLSALGLLISTSLLMCCFPAVVSLRPWWVGSGQSTSHNDADGSTAEEHFQARGASVHLHSGGTKLEGGWRGLQQAATNVSKNPEHNRSSTNTTSQVRWMSRRVSSWSASGWVDHCLQPFATPIAVLGILLLCSSFAGLLQLQTSTEFEDMFPADSRVMENLHWVEENLGTLDTLEILLTIEAPEAFSGLQRVSLVNELSAVLDADQHVESVLSAATFLPIIPTGGGTRNTIRRAVIEAKLEAEWESQDSNQFIKRFGGREIWRISTRISGLTGNNFEAIRERLLRSCNQRLQAHSERMNAQCCVTASGLRTVIESAHNALLTDLATSFATAFFMITPVMMLIVRGFASGLVLMIPNVLPVVLVFGSMGWLGIQLDVASILTASVALGIAVDDTLHFLIWYLRSRRAQYTAVDSATRAIQACGRPILNTTMICAGAMLPFFFSDFLPTSKFALLMILILGGAVVGDLVLLPALLISPLGDWIGRSKGRAETHGVPLALHEQ